MFSQEKDSYKSLLEVNEFSNETNKIMWAESGMMPSINIGFMRFDSRERLEAAGINIFKSVKE